MAYARRRLDSSLKIPRTYKSQLQSFDLYERGIIGDKEASVKIDVGNQEEATVAVTYQKFSHRLFE